MRPPFVAADRDRTFAASIDSYLRAGQYAEALVLLDSRTDLATDPAAIRLRAELLSQLGRSDEALAVLELRLSAAPDDAVARFQLGEIHFKARRDQPAQLAYRLALSGTLDAARRAIVENRLAVIRERRDWRISAGFSLAPDSNLNNGAGISQIDIFGLPFDLDEAARRKGGIAAVAYGSVERRFRLSDRTRLTAGADASITEAGGDILDTRFLSLRGGVERLTTKQGMLSVEPGYDWAWQGGRLAQTLASVRTTLETPLGEGVFVDGLARIGKVDDRLSDARDGWSYLVQAGHTRYLSASSLRRRSLVTERREVAAGSESYWYARAAQGWLMPMPYSVSAYLEPYAAHRRFDDANPLFGVARKDTEIGVSLRLSKRDWVWRGAFPFVSVSAGRNRSNIPLYTYSRERVEFGLTRQF